MTATPESTAALQMRNRYINLLAKSSAEDLIEFISSDPRYAEFMSQMAMDFVDENLSLIDEDSKFDMAMSLMDSVWLVRSKN